MKQSNAAMAGRNNFRMLAEQAHKIFGIDSLRPGQKEVISAISRGENVLAIMPTGAGKSLCYMLSTAVAQHSRHHGCDLTVALADERSSRQIAGARTSRC